MIIPFIEGDGIGPDVWKAAVKVLDAAVAKAYGGKRKVVWREVLAGEKAFKRVGEPYFFYWNSKGIRRNRRRIVPMLARVVRDTIEALKRSSPSYLRENTATRTAAGTAD